MQFFKESVIQEFFDVSIVMSFYKKLKDFRRVFPRNQKFFERNGVEVIIVMDEETEEKDLLDFIGSYPLVNWKIIINRKEHEWRNHCKVLNVGIRHASNKYILILDPEVELFTDVIYQLRYILKHYPESFATGNVIFTDYNIKVNQNNFFDFSSLAYGSIMMLKEHAETIGGYDESYIKWGGEDDNIRRRLELMGFKKMHVPQAIAIHREENSDGHASRYVKTREIPINIWKETFYPKRAWVNTVNWGREFSDICFDWLHDKSVAFRNGLLNSFEQYYCLSSNGFKNNYKIIALIQVRNEEHLIPKVLEHIDNYCDGIILLDDGSTDSSFEKAFSNKLLLKVKKKYKGYFDDLENRNLLLQLGFLFKTEWFYFIDADEQFLPDSDLYSLTEMDNIDTVLFKLIHLWNTEDYYRKDLPEGNDGIVLRYRMFRNKGFLQIISNRELHFPAVPYKTNGFTSEVLIKHFGLLDEKIRIRKYTAYKKQDEDAKKQAFGYEYLLDNNPVLGQVDQLIKNIKKADFHHSANKFNEKNTF